MTPAPLNPSRLRDLQLRSARPRSSARHPSRTPGAHLAQRGHDGHRIADRAVARERDVRVVQDEFLAAHAGHTRAAYARDLDDFLAFCATERLCALDIARAGVRDYVASLQTRGLAPATSARRMVALRGFFTTAMDLDLLAASPVTGIKVRRPRHQSRKRALDVQQLRDLLAAADAHSLRTAALAWLLATTGLRVSEALTAPVSAIRVDAGGTWLDVVCKGGVERTVPLHDPVVRRLQPLLTDRPATASTMILITRSGRAWDRHSAARTMRAVAVDAGLEGRFSPNLLRHTFVTLARGAGCSLEDVQDAVGHADPATTRAYDRTVMTTAQHPGRILLSALAVSDHAHPAGAAVEAPGGGA